MSEYRIALAGNPNTGKSTLFNALTGLNQHTGNWPGKTVSLAEGTFHHKGNDYRLIDLPGTYSLFSNSADEEVARDYIIFEQPDVTMVVVDATSLERNMNLALQVLEMTERVILCINLIDEASKQGIVIDDQKIASKLGIPVVKMSARNGEGITRLLDTLHKMVSGQIITRPYRIEYSENIERHIQRIEPKIKEIFGDSLPARWLALRLLEGDESLLRVLKQKFARKQPPARATRAHG
ncbi:MULTISPECIES: FeoB small GTPase domain-containing protein [Thermoactinomyces]|uniref:FeoB small GTPase domain-containing protein n=1 Tax=Thermoactinomyces TaxID=2023 RepID=UPI0005005658|nr:MULTISPECIES: FeoB small GTPase domain-containing protein [Thermoactinomyces]KFZ40232.1 iron transporter FeoB [Thermoactinomyces sp. Gus2-1]KYQ88026.1 iron transporter FeoB [Thermoactinomyces sp. AS95]MBH8582507.1 50S ribosome-binding GTPase [Thermoactinomyces sp. CICC 10735]MBH8584714.1 50S ribosome-binding GTPase [Thermoactinomyces sp. CICC 10520]MBI0387763.1 50S ribosome-binding GTPase [Thermoactinomyces sp. CICC 24227]